MSTAVPSLSEVEPKIIEAAGEGDLVLFVGAGLSKLLGYPTWSEAAARAIKSLREAKLTSYLECEILNKLSPKMQLSIATDIFERAGSKINYREIFSREKDSSDHDILYTALSKIGSVFVTTNYDECLDNAAISLPTSTKPADISKDCAVQKIFCWPEDMSVAKLDSLGTVLHLHGSVRHEGTMVVTTRQYLEHYQKPYITTFLTELFSTKVVLFIGYSLEEVEILEFIIRKRSRLDDESKSEAKHFWLFPRLSSDNAIFDHLKFYYQKHCNVNLIGYNIDVNGHEQLARYILDWSEELKDKVRPPVFPKEAKTIDRLIR